MDVDWLIGEFGVVYRVKLIKHEGFEIVAAKTLKGIVLLYSGKFPPGKCTCICCKLLF